MSRGKRTRKKYTKNLAALELGLARLSAAHAYARDGIVKYTDKIKRNEARLEKIAGKIKTQEQAIAAKKKELEDA